MSRRATSARLRKIIGRVERVRLVVVGDLVADEFIYGRIDRVSREAPVLILKYNSTEVVPGGAGNAANNASALGAKVSVIGAVGRDSAGDRLIDALGATADVAGVVRTKAMVTPVKTRILAGGVHSAKQQVVRIDRAGDGKIADKSGTIERTLARALRRSDAVILSDYGAGLITPQLWNRALATA